MNEGQRNSKMGSHGSCRSQYCPSWRDAGMPLLSRITLAAGLDPGCRGLWLRLTQLPALHHTLLPQAANPPQLS